ncbi:unnamed protein product [Dracunculus medinensis]|uniref:Uncharacterized protein n=1 Tax=Dracunculus medinensis TaxID=318479 RepID=A0A0N4UKD6_DRAME|nr:unnamed protein product [Dracunculus medinensis]
MCPEGVGERLLLLTDDESCGFGAEGTLAPLSPNDCLIPSDLPIVFCHNLFIDSRKCSDSNKCISAISATAFIYERNVLLNEEIRTVASNSVLIGPIGEISTVHSIDHIDSTGNYLTEERFVNIDEKCDVSLPNYHLFNEEINFVQDDLLLNTVNFDLLDNFVHKNTEYNCSNSIAEFDDDLIVDSLTD